MKTGTVCSGGEGTNEDRRRVFWGEGTNEDRHRVFWGRGDG